MVHAQRGVDVRLHGRPTLPRLYPILDAEVLAAAGLALGTAGAALHEAGLRWVQYRNKQGSDADVVRAMRMLRGIFSRGSATLLLNDRVHLYAQTEADGMHIGQQDMPAAEARRLLGVDALLGVSTHNSAQLEAAAASDVADYIAIGPVFATGTKQNPDPVVGLAGVAAARMLTHLPLVAIGGIAPAQVSSVLEAGANSVAMISALIPQPEQSMTERVRDILLLFR